jgi:hypothetical protein
MKEASMRRLIFLCALPLAAIVAQSASGNSEQGRVVRELGVAAETGYFPGADGLRLFYRKVGNGAETAVYLHGGPWNMSDGGYNLDELGDGRTLIAFDQRSGGHSELANTQALLTADYYVRDLEALRQHFELEQTG